MLASCFTVMNKLLSLIIVLYFSVIGFAQDPVFNQTDNSRNYLNPAYISTVKSFAADVSYRNQWPELSGNYKTLAVQVNQYLGKGNGVSVHFVNDNASDLILKRELGIGYAKRISVAAKHHFSIGTQISYFSKSLMNRSDLVFGDMIDPRRGFKIETQEASRGSGPRGFDVNAGALYYNKYFFVGYTVKHITQPNESFIGGNARLPMRHGIQLGGKIKWSQVDFIPSVRMFVQGSQFTNFAALKVNWRKLEVNTGIQFDNGIYGGVGFNSDHFNISYNYTKSINGISSTVSTHEIRMGCDFKLFKKENEHFFDF